jgi:hypothetical protein
MILTKGANFPSSEEGGVYNLLQAQLLLLCYLGSTEFDSSSGVLLI